MLLASLGYLIVLWRYLKDDEVDADAGLAVDEAMMMHLGRGGSPDAAPVVRLYTYRDAALVGRYQHAAEEIDIARCATHGIDVDRRPTGGGAIVMGPAQLGIAVAERAPAGSSPRAVLRGCAQWVIDGLSRLGIAAQFRGKNDLVVDGRKIAGLGLYEDREGALLFHASVLVDLDVERMLSILRIPGAAQARVEERMTTVRRERGEPLSVDEVREVIAGAVPEDLQPSTLDDAERARRDELLATKYGQRNWIDEVGPQGGGEGTATLKTSKGLLRFHVTVQGDVLKSVLVSGSFVTVPPSVRWLEAALRWCRVDLASIAEVVRARPAPGELGADPDSVAVVLWRAARRAQRLREGAHPHRGPGACYAPAQEEVP